MNLQSIKTLVLKFIKDEDGLTMVEYAVAGGLITLGAVGAFTTLGTDISDTIGNLSCYVKGNTGC